MPQVRLDFAPGVNKMKTPTLNRGGWSDSNLVRFRQGLPEKWAGWVKYSTTLLTGVCRSLLSFATLGGDKLLAAGTNNHLYLFRGGTLYDITPVDHTVPVAANKISTTNGQTKIGVDTGGTSHGLSVGDYFTLDAISGQSRTPSGITVATVVLSGDYVVTALDATNPLTVFYFAAASTANANATYGSTATVTCYLPAGSANATPGLGWGAGGWGISAWGVASTVAAATLPARFWSLDAWGQSLVGAPSQGKLLAWSPDISGNVTTRAAIITNGTPSYGPSLRNGFVVVMMPERHIMVLGAADLNGASNWDPMLARWCDVEDYTTWNATSLNSAGSFRIQGGTQLVGGWNTTLQTLIWSDTHLHLCRFIGLPYVYSFTMLGQNCGLVGPHAFNGLGGVVYWMSARGFWSYAGGSPQQLFCPLIETVFSNLNVAQQSKVCCGVNNTTSEIIWFYPSGSAIEPDTYIAFSPTEAAVSGQAHAWSCGMLQRCAWVDNDLLGAPVAVTTDGQLYQHETGNDADGSAMGDYLTSGFVDVTDGEDIIFLSQVAPDFLNQVGPVNLTFTTRDWPNSPTRTRGPYQMTPDTTTRGFRARGRQVAITLASVGTGSTWRMGAVRANIQKDGQR
jgi:hypothetical protein